MMMTCKHKTYGIFLIIIFLLVPIVALAENIDPDNDGSQYAWGENVGWINLEPSQGGGITVTDSVVTGKAWGENVGWINLSPATGGVANDGEGNLSGYAWGENVGWINFNPTGARVTIDPATGAFSGKAWGENIGWINFAPNGKPIKTSWRPPKPDLVVTSLSAPDTASPGEEIVITDTTMNSGLGSSPESTTGYYLSTDASLDSEDIFLYSRPVSALDASASSVGENYHVTIPPYPPMGNCYIIAKADFSGAIIEDAESNNTNTKPITIATVTVPDITCSLTPSGAIVLADGSTLKLFAAVQNNTDQVQVFQFATRVIMPNGNIYPSSGWLVGPATVTLNPHKSKSKLLTHFIPYNVQFGIYTYRGYVGTVSPRLPYNKCEFNFEVTPY
jgi:hypothetical protein